MGFGLTVVAGTQAPLDDQPSPLRTRDQAYVYRVKATHRFVPQAMVASLINALVVTAALWEALPHNRLMGWASGLFLLSAIRWVLYRKHPPHMVSTVSVARIIHWQLRLGLLASGLLWAGLIASINSTWQTDHVLIVVIIAAGMVAGSAAAFQGLMDVSIGFTSLVCVGLMIGMWRFDASVMIWAVLVVPFFALMMIALARRQSRILNALVRAEYRYKRTAEKLTAASQKEKTLRSRLKTGEIRINQVSDNLAQRELLLTHVLSNAPVAVLVLDDAGTIRWAKGRGLSVIGESGADLEGRKLAPVSQELAHLAQRRSQTHASDLDEDEYSVVITRGAASVEWRCANAIDPGTGQSMLLLTGVDVSEHVSMRELQSRFVTIINHQLRNPLSKIKGSLGLLPAVLHQDVGRSEQLVEIAQRGCKELEHMVDRVAFVGTDERIDRADSNQIFKTDQLRKIFTAASQELARRFPNLGRVTIGDMPEFRFRFEEDSLPVLIEELLVSVLNLARDGHDVHVTFHITQMEHAQLSMDLETELGDLAEDPYVSLFDLIVPPRQADNASYQNLGIGLYLVRRILDRNGGSIKILRGQETSRIRVRIPLTNEMTEY